MQKEVERTRRLYSSEDIQNIPALLRDLSVQDITAEPDGRLTLQERCEICFRQGSSQHPVHSMFRHQEARRRSFHGQRMLGHCPNMLAETGLYKTARGQLVCYHCGQTLVVRAGEDPLVKHNDLYRNCRHVCRMLGRRPLGSEPDVLSRAPEIIFPARRRHFSI